MTAAGQRKDGWRDRRYRFGFVLNTTLGNLTRYQNLRKYAERDPEVESSWAPVSHYTPPDHPSRLRFLPEPLFMRVRVLQQAWPVLGALDQLDAVMVHLFEADVLCSLRNYMAKRPLHISSNDEAPIIDRSTYPLYPHELSKPVWRQKLRLAIDHWRVRHTDEFIPFSRWVSNVLVQHCSAPVDRVHPIHVGIDLEIWKPRSPAPESADRRLRILFVGGDFIRKGGELLLDVFKNRFQDVAELHLVTRQAPTALPPHVHVHADFHPNDERLTDLYATCDVAVVPTFADIGPLWVFIEAMAMGLPVIGTDTGANTELVRHGQTGLIIGIGNGDELAAAIEAMLADPAERQRMGQRGRALIEAEYSASCNVPRILETMKRAVDRASGVTTFAAQARGA